MTHPVNIIKLSGSDSDLQNYIPDLAQLRIKIFRDFPYLYDGTVEYEEKYLKTYTDCSESVVVLVLDGNRVVGATTGLPLDAESTEFKQPFIDNGMNPESIFYCAESLLLPEYRGQGIYPKFFEAREGHAKNLGRFDWVTFCCVQRPENHPLRPVNHVPLDRIWSQFGYTRHPELVAHFQWKDVNEPEESSKPMVFWMKSLRNAL